MRLGVPDCTSLYLYSSCPFFSLFIQMTSQPSREQKKSDSSCFVVLVGLNVYFFCSGLWQDLVGQKVSVSPKSTRVTIPAERQFLFIGAATDKSVDFNASPSKIKLRLFRLKHTQKKHSLQHHTYVTYVTYSSWWFKRDTEDRCY